MKKTALISLFFLFMLSSLAAMPQKESADPSLWPEEEVTVICPWAVGGVADIVNRSLAPHLEKELGQLRPERGASLSNMRATLLEKEDFNICLYFFMSFHHCVFTDFLGFPLFLNELGKT